MPWRSGHDLLSKNLIVLADHEFMPDDLVESMWTYATEEFDYEAHLDLLER